MTELPLKIVIGSETEYFQHATSPSHIIRSSSLPQLMLKHTSSWLPSFTGERGGAETLEEHAIAEQDMRRLPFRAELIDFLENRPTASHFQRWGLTGIYPENGFRIYEDMGHYEVARGEACNPYDAVVVEKASDVIAVESARRAEEELREKFPGAQIFVIKNNSDGLGHSYAAHESYLLRDSCYEGIVEGACRIDDACSDFGPNFLGFSPELLVAQATLLYFIARQIITGSGKAGDELYVPWKPKSVENARSLDFYEGVQHSRKFFKYWQEYCQNRGKVHEPVPYQISQRADFMKCVATPDTTGIRGIINLRDVSYAGYGLRRFHVIVGDNNLSELSLFLKYGMSALFFMMLEDGACFEKGDYFTSSLRDPVCSHHVVSRDLSLQEKLVFTDGREARALDIMNELVAKMKVFVETKQLPSVWREVTHWAGLVLRGLSGNRFTNEASSSLDWVLLEKVLRIQKKKEGALTPKRMRDIDFDYHNLTPSRSIFLRLMNAGKLPRIVKEDDVRRAIYAPLADSRAWLRGEVIKRYKKDLTYVRWHEMVFRFPDCVRILNLPIPYDGGKADAESYFGGDPSSSEFLNRIASQGPLWAYVTTRERGI